MSEGSSYLVIIRLASCQGFVRFYSWIYHYFSPKLIHLLVRVKTTRGEAPVRVSFVAITTVVVYIREPQ